MRGVTRLSSDQASGASGGSVTSLNIIGGLPEAPLVTRCELRLESEPNYQPSHYYG